MVLLLVHEACERLLAVILGKQRFDSRIPLCYSYIVVAGESGEEKILGLVEAIEEVLATLPLTQGQKDLQKWGRRAEVLRLRFGLKNGFTRTLEEIGQELGGITKGRVREIEARAFSLLRHPSRSRLLKQFLVPSPEDRAREARDFHKLEEDLLRRATEKPSSTEGAGSGVERIEEPSLADDDPAVKAAFEAVASRWPKTRTRRGFTSHPLPTLVWNALARAGIPHNAFAIGEVIADWKHRRIHLIGPAGLDFLRQVLQEFERQKASSS